MNWQPMDTAPRDREIILLLGNGLRVRGGVFRSLSFMPGWMIDGDPDRIITSPLGWIDMPGDVERE
jgi:hypothetical protein